MTEFNTWFPTSRYGHSTLNVRDFGATGDGSTNDGPALQLALNALQTGGSADGLYIPAGTYKSEQVLYITNTTGVRIFGDGVNATVIKYAPSVVDAGNVEGADASGPGFNASQITPVIMTNGFSYSTMEGFTLHNAVGGTTHVGIYIYQDTPATKGHTTGNIFKAVSAEGLDMGGVLKAATGFLIGWDALCSEQLFIGCQANFWGNYGWSVCAQNALNINLLGCGGINNNVWARTSVGQMNIYGGSLADNIIDIQSGNNPMSIIAVRTESSQFVDMTAIQGFVSIIGCLQIPNDNEAGYFVSLQQSSMAVIQSCQGTVVHPDSCRVLGGSNCPVWIRGSQWSNGTTFLKDFVGVIKEYNNNDLNGNTVAGLPVPSATSITAGSWRGLRSYVTDSNVAASSSNFGATLTGGGSNAVPVWCNGTNWRIG